MPSAPSASEPLHRTRPARSGAAEGGVPWRRILPEAPRGVRRSSEAGVGQGANVYQLLPGECPPSLTPATVPIYR